MTMKVLDKPEAGYIYQKIGKEIIDKGVNTLKHYEKILVSYNDNIITLKKIYLIKWFF